MSHNIENNEQNSIPPIKKKSNRKIWFSLFWWIVGITNVILCLVIFFQLLFRFYTDEIIGKVLQEVVEIKSDGLYKLTYNNIDLNFIGNHIEINNLKLTPSHEVYKNLKSTNKSLNKLYQLHIEEVFIDGFNIGEFYFQKKLSLNDFQVSDLDVLIEGDAQTTETDKEQAFKMSNLYFLISGYLKEFQIENFELDDGAFSYKHYSDSAGIRKVDRVFELQKIELKAKEFVIDSLSTENYPFQLTDIQVSLGANKVQLSHNITVEIDSLCLGANDEFLEVEQLKVKLKNIEGTKIELPALSMRGLNYLKFYLERKLEVDSLIISKPKLALSAPKKSNINQSKLRVQIPNLYKPLSNYLYSLKLGSLLLDSAMVEASSIPRLQNASIHLQGVFIDSLTQDQRRPFAYSDSISVGVSDFEYALPDSLHNIAWNELKYSTKSKNAVLTGFEVFTNKEARFLVSKRKVQQRSLINATVPRLTLQNLDVWEFITNQTLELDAIRISYPSFDLFTVKKDNFNSPKSQVIDPENLYPLIENNLKWLKTDRINIYNGRFDFSQQILEDSILSAGANGIDLFLSRFEINKDINLDTTRLFQSKDIRLSLKNGFLDLPDTSHRIELSEFKFALKDSSVELTGVNVIPKYTPSQLTKLGSKNTFIRAKIPKILIGSAELRKLVLEQEGDFGFLSLIQPKVSVYKPLEQNEKNLKGSQIGEAFPFLTGNRIKIDSGKVQLFTYGSGTVAKSVDLPAINTVINQFSTDSLGKTPADILSAADLKFETRNYTLLLPDSIHQLNAGYLKLAAADKLLNLKNVEIEPRSSELALTNSSITLKVPELDFRGLEVDRFIKDKVFITDTLRVSSPNIQTFVFKRNNSTSANFSWEDLPKSLTKSLALYEIKTLLFEKSDLNIIINDTTKNDIQEISIQEASFKVDSFHISSDTKPSVFRPLYSSMTQLSLKSVEHSSNKGKVSFDSLYFHDNLPSTLAISKLKVASRYPVNSSNTLYFGKKPQYNFSLEELKIDSLNLFDLLVQNNLTIRSIELNTPILQFKTTGQSKTSNRNIFHTDSLRSILSKVFNKVNLNEVHIKNGRVNLEIQSQPKSELLSYTSIKDSLYQKGDLINLKPVVILRHDKQKKISIDTIKSRRYRLTNLALPIPKPSIKISLKGIEGNHYKISTDTLQVNQVAEVLLHERINYKFQDLKVDLPDTTFLITAKDLNFDTKSKRFDINRLEARHKINPDKLFELKGVQTDHMDFQIGKLSFRGFDIDEIADKGILNIRTIRVDSLAGNVFRDKNWPFPRGNRPPMPQEAIKELPFTFTLDSLQVRRSAITYKEAAEKVESDTSAYNTTDVRTGQIQFRNLQANLLGLTNDPIKLQQKKPATLYAEALLMGNGKLSVNFEFDLWDPKSTYRFDGELDSMALPQLNPMLEKVAFLQIRSGLARRLRFWVTANEDDAVGKMRFLYNNLSISLVDKTYNVGLHEYIFSLLANTFFIRTSNSRFFLFYKDGKIYAPKDPSRSMFNHWAKALLSGVRSSITDWKPKEGKQLLKNWEKENKGWYKR